MEVILQPTGHGSDRCAALSPDAELSNRVRLYLARVGRTVEHLKVEVHEGVVTLRGRVPSYYTRQLAIACAQRVAGVRKINDQIRALVPLAPNVKSPEAEQFEKKGDRHDDRENLRA
jgi:hypothetical protein